MKYSDGISRLLPTLLMYGAGFASFCRRKPDSESLSICRVLATFVPYGDAVCTRGDYVWAAFEDERLVCIAATADEVRRKYREQKRVGGKNVVEVS